MYLHSISLLRGVAALAVCWYHFTFYNPGYLDDGFLKQAGQYGKLGVEVFFIISGFVIPWALYHAKYQINGIGRFLLKRVVRLDPPYLVTIVSILILDYLSTLSPLYAGKPYLVHFPRLFLHLGYLNAFTPYPWLNPIFWTLAIEFQYYLIMSLFYFLITHSNFRVRFFSIAVFLATFFAAQEIHHFFGWKQRHNPLVIYYAPLFILGIVLFQWKIKRIHWAEFAFFLAFSLFLCKTYHPLMPVLALFTVVMIHFTKIEHPMGNFLGNISYSLYLLHIPIGMRVINLLSRFMGGGWEGYLLFVLALGVSLGSAYLFYLLIERPSQQLSKRIRYQPFLKPLEAKIFAGEKQTDIYEPVSS